MGGHAPDRAGRTLDGSARLYEGELGRIDPAGEEGRYVTTSAISGKPMQSTIPHVFVYFQAFDHSIGAGRLRASYHTSVEFLEELLLAVMSSNAFGPSGPEIVALSIAGYAHDTKNID